MDVEARERLAALETIARRAEADREEMKTELQAVRKELSELRSSVQSFVDQVKGGTTAIKWAYAVGAFVVTSMAWASGLVHKLFPVLAR